MSLITAENDESGIFQFDFEEAVYGPWIEYKSPSSLELRRFLTRLARHRHLYMPGQERFRQFYRKTRSEALVLEKDWIAVRRKTLNFLLKGCKTEGGVQ